MWSYVSSQARPIPSVLRITYWKIGLRQVCDSHRSFGVFSLRYRPLPILCWSVICQIEIGRGYVRACELLWLHCLSRNDHPHRCHNSPCLLQWDRRTKRRTGCPWKSVRMRMRDFSWRPCNGHSLSMARQTRYAIRKDRQRRISCEWSNGNVRDVLIEDYQGILAQFIQIIQKVRRYDVRLPWKSS
jgi:hypothetical protein